MVIGKIDSFTKTAWIIQILSKYSNQRKIVDPDLTLLNIFLRIYYCENVVYKIIVFTHVPLNDFRVKNCISKTLLRCTETNHQVTTDRSVPHTNALQRIYFWPLLLTHLSNRSTDSGGKVLFSRVLMFI